VAARLVNLSVLSATALALAASWVAVVREDAAAPPATAVAISASVADGSASALVSPPAQRARVVAVRRSRAS